MQKQRNSCYTYFSITGAFDPEEITKILGLSPFQSWRIGDRRRDGSLYDFASWQYGYCDEFDVMVENQMRRSIAGLLNKIEALNEIRAKFQTSFCLEVVPKIYLNEITPCLNPPLDVIDFCHETRTEIDIDYYILCDQD